MLILKFKVAEPVRETTHCAYNNQSSALSRERLENIFLRGRSYTIISSIVKEFKMIKDSQSWSATVDGWQSKHGRQNVFSVTIRTLDNDWDVICGVLAAKPIHGPNLFHSLSNFECLGKHTSERIAELIRNTVESEVGALPVSLVTDNARSMVKAGDLLGTIWSVQLFINHRIIDYSQGGLWGPYYQPDH